MIICLFLLLAGMYFNLESAMPAAPAAAAKLVKKHPLSSLAKHDLFDAACKRDCLRIKAALASGVSVNAQDQDGNTALHMVVAPCDAKQKKESKETREKRIQCIQLLMRQHGADCTIKNKKGNSVLDALSIPFAAQRVSLDNDGDWQALIPEEEQLMSVMPTIIAHLRYVQNPAHDWYDQLKKIMVKAVTLYTRGIDRAHPDVLETIMREGILMPDYPTFKEEEAINKQYHHGKKPYRPRRYNSEFDLQEELDARAECMEQEHRDSVRAAFKRIVVHQGTIESFPRDLMGLIEEHLYAYPEKRILPRHIIDLLSIKKPTSCDYDKQKWKKQKEDIASQLVRFQELRPLRELIYKKKTFHSFIDLALEQDNDELFKALKIEGVDICKKAVQMGAHDTYDYLKEFLSTYLDNTIVSYCNNKCKSYTKGDLEFLMLPEIRRDITDWPKVPHLTNALFKMSHDQIGFEPISLLIRRGVDIDFEGHIQLLSREILKSQGNNPNQERAKLLLLYLQDPESIKAQLTDADQKEFAAIAQEREDNRKLDKAYSEKQKKEQAHHETQCAAK